jgi:cation:H+ antiporter
MGVALSMAMSLAMILFGAELFTNAVEWLGRKLRLGEGAIGSVLAAIGTALPETAVPVTAIALGGGASSAEEVGIGGILGAPFLLVTLGSMIVALSLVWFRRGNSRVLNIVPEAYRRDMSFFLIAYAVTVLVGCVPIKTVHALAPCVLTGLYLVFLFWTLRDRTQLSVHLDLHPLYLHWNKQHAPPLLAVFLQLACALAAIVGGAHMLSTGVAQVAVSLNLPPFVVSAILIPLATELPETLNSVVWIRQGKDALAIGNITGAMVFQSTLVPALGIALTKWNLNSEALLTGGLTLAAGAMLLGVFQLRSRVQTGILFAASTLYWVLPLHTVALRYNLTLVKWVGLGLLAWIFLWSVKSGLRTESA